MSIPNPISLLQLRQCYDTFVADPTIEHIHSLRVVCSILTTLLGSTNMWNVRLTRTARRCYLIEQYLSFQQDGPVDESDEDEEAFLFQVSIQASPDATAWTWSMAQKENDGNIVLAMDREELANEEATLWEMANTPIPSLSEYTGNDRVVSEWNRRRKENWMQQIRCEFVGVDKFD